MPPAFDDAPAPKSEWASGSIKPIPARHLTIDTCEKFEYRVGTFRGQPCHIAVYYREGKQVAQHIRFEGKRFEWVGDSSGVELFGQHLWRDGGKFVVLTEGEIDCMSISQMQGLKWPVVSLPSGVGSAKKAVAKNLQFLSAFDEIVLCLDEDEAGRQAIETIAPILPCGKVKIAHLPLKDANEMLKAGRGKELIDCIWSAQRYRPEGVVTARDVLQEALNQPEEGLPWVFDGMTEISFGRRLREVHTFGAGTGVGKTAFLLKQMHFDVTKLNKKVGAVLLESDPTLTLKMLAGMHAKRMFHIPAKKAGWKQEELVKACQDIVDTDNLYMTTTQGAYSWEELSARLRFLKHSEGVDLVYVDHLTGLAAGRDDKQDERVFLEQTMAQAAMLTQELNITLHLVSHLATPEGKPHEEGGHVAIRHFKGSRAIGFWSHFIWGIERNTLAKDPDTKMTAKLNCLKARTCGWNTGKFIKAKFDPITGDFREEVEEFDPTAGMGAWDANDPGY
jgi:twinkle protein